MNTKENIIVNLKDNRQKANLNILRKKVLASYQDIKGGKGREYREFFNELEQKYQK